MISTRSRWRIVVFMRIGVGFPWRRDPRTGNF